VAKKGTKRKPKPKGERGEKDPLDLIEVGAAITKCCGNFTAAARYLGACRQTISRLVSANESLQRVTEEARESALDDVEGALLTAAKQGKAWAVCFYLKCQGKHRGWVEKTPEQMLSLEMLLEHLDPEVATVLRRILAANLSGGGNSTGGGSRSPDAIPG
jgi:hypothetical protein